MNKRIFEKVLHEKGKKIAFSCIKSIFEYYNFVLVLGMAGLVLTGETIFTVRQLIACCGIAIITSFVVIFLREVHNESKKWGAMPLYNFILC